jgi:SP family sugar:H+ symporter-like MFS transporter
LIGFLTPLAADGISYAYGFVFFATNAIAGIVVYFFLYESRTLSLENVDMMYGIEGLKPWNSTHWVPPGYVTRKQRDEAAFRKMSHSGGAGGPLVGGEKKSESFNGSGDLTVTGESRQEHVGHV